MIERGADPALIIQLAEELQKRIGIQPLVKVDAYAMPNESGVIFRIMRIEPGSMSEISRLIRAARTMKLHIRCIGSGSSLNKTILINDFSVVVDLRFLSDSEHVERVAVRMKDMSYVEGIRVLAGVSIKEFCEYQIQTQICVPTNTEALDRTVVGAIISGSHGAITSAKCSLADYVIQIRLLDIHGDIQTYVDNSFVEFDDSPNTIKNIVTNLGMNGIVYDVVLKYDVLKSVKVNYEFLTIEKLLSNVDYLTEQINSTLSTQLVYVPFNSVTYDCASSTTDIDNWWFKGDEIIIRTLDEVEIDSGIRQYMTVVDEKKGCAESLLTQAHLTPLIMKDANTVMKRKFYKPLIQYLPWAIHCFPSISNGFHDLTITIPLDDMQDFLKAFYLILEKIEYFAHANKMYPVNAGVRVNFTLGTDMTLCPGQKKTLLDKFAHIKVLSVLSTPNWGEISFAIIDEILRQIPTAALQWSSEWIDRPIVVERVLELNQNGLDNLKEEIEKTDRDGVFLNDHLQRMFYPHLQTYRATYKHLQNEYLSKLG